MYKEDTVFYPQDEMTTVLLPVTSGCSYNKCVFCSMYKDIKYCEIPFHNIEMELLHGYKYTEKIFLTGADPLNIGFKNMKTLLELIHKHLPYCACVASYASIKSISKYSAKELSILHDLGLRLLYIGFETGRNDILRLMNKGHTVNEAIEQGKKLNDAKLSFNSILMYGIAGKDEGIKNATATAHMLNSFISNKIITMNLTVFFGTELNNMIKKGVFVPAQRTERLFEIRTLIECLEPKQSTIFDTTHPTNIIKIKGTLPQDKEMLLNNVTYYIKNNKN